MIKLFHGTNKDFPKINLRKGKPYKDFGKGFYLTDIHQQAIEMSRRRTLIDGGLPIVQTYMFDENAFKDKKLNIKIFENVSEEWALFILSNRKKGSIKHNYDIVIGPIADDGVIMQIDRYLNHMIDLKTLVKELTFKKLNNQYYFGTERAIKYLTRI